MAAALIAAPAAQATHAPGPRTGGKHHTKTPHKSHPRPPVKLTPPKPVPPPGPCAGTDVTPTAANVDATRASVLCLVNGARAAAGAAPVAANVALSRAAKAYAFDMAARKFFGHVSPAGKQLGPRLRAAGYLDHVSNFGLGEDLGWGSLADASPAALIAVQLADPAHRAMLVNRSFREIGIGVAPAPPISGAPEPGATLALDFGWTGHPAR